MSEADIQGLVQLAVSTFGPGMSAEEVKEHILPVDRLYVARDNGAIVGFASLNFSPDFSYLAGTAVHPKKQGSGLYHDFAKERILDSLEKGLEKIKTRTQNPIIEHTLRNSFACLVQEKIIENFSFHRELLEGLYGRMLTKAIPKSRDMEVNNAYSSLNYARGDAFMLSFEVKR